jgi:hydrogenase expression/formation protein HypD
MKYIDEYRDPELAKGLLLRIEHLAGKIGKNISIMEICGSHTAAIGRFGIRELLPDNIRLLSGPGCPVCVTSSGEIDAALYLAMQENVLFTSFGDMLRVPASGGITLQMIRAEGADVRVVLSPLDALRLAEENPDRDVVFMGIGFETTAPTIAATMKTAKSKQIGNFSVLSVHKVIPPALQILIDSPELRIDGFLCPGHVSVIIGAEAYRPIAEAQRAAVITGFEPIDILQGIVMILEQIDSRQFEVAIQYSRGVKPEGNARAREAMAEVFATVTAEWRGIGWIPCSGLTPREAYQNFDARKRFVIPEFVSQDPPGCSCGDILCGVKTPPECPLFRTVCTPVNPIGPCMVSSEGTCAAYFKYHLNEKETR